MDNFSLNSDPDLLPNHTLVFKGNYFQNLLIRCKFDSLKILLLSTANDKTINDE